MPFSKDDLWPHFVPIWKELIGLSSGENLQIAGGYGLFLKQEWLIENSEIQTVVPMQQWIEPTPRATNDFDLLLGLTFISNEAINREIPQILRANGFEVTDKKLGQRWQFVKEIGEGKVILAELHAPTPEAGAENLRTEKIRIKHKPSLGTDGIHGRHNREAVGCELSPFTFTLDSTPLAVPNPVTWSVMKLTAMADFWEKANDPDLTAEIRAKARKQAEKHAQDVCRTIAMTTIEERDRAAETLESIHETEPFQKAAKIFIDGFRIEAWAIVLVQDNWESDDLDIILSVVETWFSDSHS